MKGGVLKSLSVAGVICGVSMVNHLSMINTYAAITPEFTERYLTEERRKVEYGSSINGEEVLKNESVKYLGLEGNDNDFNLLYEISDKNIFGQEVKKKIVVPFKVEDTMKPLITLRESEVQITQGSDYDVEDNIISVRDPVDGAIEYDIEHDIDTTTPGIYTAKISATDKNGLTSEKEFSVEVIKPVVVKKENVQTQTQNTTSGGWWTQGNAGAIKVGGYQAALNYCDLSISGNCNSVFDAGGVAGITTNFAGIPYIMDHDGQGFLATLNNNSLTIRWADGREETLYKVSTHIQSYRTGEWYSDDGYDNLYGTDGRLVTQVCLNGGIAWVYWN